jgi:hypothetical protein
VTPFDFLSLLVTPTNLLLVTDLCCSVKIQKITVPSVVVMDYNPNMRDLPNLSAPEFTLDCDFDIDMGEHGLVIKWFLNNKLVYQWIPTTPPRPPSVMGLFRNRIKTNYTVSDDPLKLYRGVAVTKPTLNFSGEYMCSVQTFQTSDKKSSFLQIIGEHSRPHYSNALGCRKVDNAEIISN